MGNSIRANYRAESKPYSVSSTSASSNYGLTQTQSSSSSLTFENTLLYYLPQLGKHNIDVIVGQSIERSNWSTALSMTASDGEDTVNSLVLNGWNYAIMSNSLTLPVIAALTARDKAARLFLRLCQLEHDVKYMATVTVRADGSSNFARGNRWGIFLSMSAGCVATSEPFMRKTSNWLDYLKIRASWRQNGNCNIDNFYYLSNIGFSPTSYADYGYKFSSDMAYTVTQNSYTTGAYAKNVPNEDVTWETSEQ